MDFALTSDLDLRFDDDGSYDLQDNGETTVINAFFTDARYNGQRGYWVDEVASSELWRYEQARLTSSDAVEVKETARDVSEKLVKAGLFTKIDADTFITDNMFMTLWLKCYNKNDVVVERKFTI